MTVKSTLLLTSAAAVGAAAAMLLLLWPVAGSAPSTNGSWPEVQTRSPSSTAGT